MTRRDSNRLLAMMPVRNEADRFLPLVLNRLSEIVDGIVILDDASNDETPDLCRNEPYVIKYHRLKEPLFLTDESVFRKMLWDMTVKLEPSWIMAVDADEIFEDKIRSQLPRLMKTGADLVRFPVIHFWGDFRHYRVDGLWNPVISKVPCLFRYQKNLIYHWPGKRLHCGRFPVEVYTLPSTASKIRLLHLGYVRKEDQPRKYRRYINSDPEGRFCPLSHYRSIMCTRPKLRRWKGENI